MGYRVVSLGDVIQLEDSKRQPLSSRERDSRRGIYPYYGAQGIVDYLDDYTYEGDYLLVAEDGENLRSRKQPIANAAHGRFRVNNHAHVIAATKCCNLIYLRHLLNSMDIAAYVTGSTQPKLSQTSLLNMKVELPEIDRQDAIAAFLHCFDAKITANAKLNGYLDEYIDATLRNILNQQEGAEVSLGDYLYIKGRIGWKGLKKSEYLSDSDYRIINGESLTMSGIDWNKAGYISKERYDESPEIMLEVGDILLSKDGTIGKIGYVDELERPTTVASGIFVIRNLRKDVLSTHFVYYLLKSRLFKAFIASRTEGSVIPHLYQKDFVEFLFPLPPIDVMKKFDKLTGPMFQQTIVNAHENKRLAELRDALLPKLMSGEIDVSKIDLTQLNSHLEERRHSPLQLQDCR